MKKPKKKQLTFSLITLAILLQSLVPAYGQQDASATWSFDENLLPAIIGNISALAPVKGASDDYFTLSANDDLVIFRPHQTYYTQPDRYIQFELAPESDCDFHVTRLTIISEVYSEDAKIKFMHSTSTEIETFQPLGNELDISTVADTDILSELNVSVPEGSSLYIRLYFTYKPTLEVHLKLHDIKVEGYTVSNTPTASIQYDPSGYCVGEGTAGVTLTGTQGGTFSSTSGLAIEPLTGSINLAESTGGTYTVNYTYSGEVLATTSVTLHSPECTITGPAGPVPASSTNTFMAPEGMTLYSWSVAEAENATITGSTSGQSVTVQAGTSGGVSFTLSLTVEDANECTSTCSIPIEIVEAGPGVFPTATLSGTQTVCAGGSADLVVNLTGQEPWTFTWFDGVNAHLVETSDPQHIITVFPTENTTYSLKGLVTDGSGNSNTATGEAKVYFGPITSAPKMMACPNKVIEVPITVESFKEVRDISLALQYDPAVLTYQGFKNGDIGFGENGISSIGVTDNSYGNYRIITLSNTSDDNLPTLSDGATLLTLNFNYQGGTTDLKWIDAPDDSWCSYSFLSILDETGFESQAFCDVPAETYYINGSVRQLVVSGTDVSLVANISTITGTPVIIPVSVTYPDLEAQNVSSDVLTDARISYGSEGTFPSGARIFKVTYNGVPVLIPPFDMGGKNEALLSEILGTPANPLLNHSGQTVTWEFFVDGITTPTSVPVNIEALAYTDLTNCVIIMDTESVGITHADATLTASESVTVCEGESLLLSAEIGYPAISNLNPAVKADARISAMNAFPDGTIINWSYNSSTSGSFTLSANTTEIMLSTITGTLPNSLQGHSGTDVWTFEISNAGLMDDNILTIQAVALLEEEYYFHAEDQVTLTVHPLPEITAATLLTSTDKSNWTTLTGGFTTGYEMCADPAEDYHYLDINELTSTVELIHNFEMNAFYLDVNNVPAEFGKYWNDKGVNALAIDGWQAVMYDIITGELPMFYISFDGTDYKLIDGFLHLYNNNTDNLRFSGDYPAGSYTYNGTVSSTDGCVSEAVSFTLDLSSAPVITCPGIITKFNDAGECGAVVTFEASATGTPAPEISYMLENGTPVEPGDFFPVGETQVTATAGNDCKSVSCSFIVKIEDNEDPIITCPVSGNVNVKLTSTSTYVHSGTGWNATADDNCSVSQLSYKLTGATEGEGDNLNGIAFNLGVTTVTWTATDASSNTEVCSFTVTVTGVLLSGTVKYYNKEETPMDDATVSIRLPGTGTEVATAITNAAGEYSVVNVGPGLYDVIITTEKPMRSINSTDAGQVNAWNIAQSYGSWPSIEKVRFLAGDVNGDGYAESGDATIIQNYFLILGSENLFNKSWVFWKTNDAVTLQPQTGNVLQINITTTGSHVIQDFYGLVCGDFNRSNLTAAISMNGLDVKSARTEESFVFLQKGNVLFTEADTRTELPIRALSSMQVGAISLILDFPSNQFEIMDVYLNNDPGKSAGFNVTDNILVIGWNSLNPLIVEAGEPLVTLCLKIKEGEFDVPSYFGLVPNPLNELADENMEAIDDASLIMDGLMLKEILTGIESADRSGLTLTCWPNPVGGHAAIKYTLPGSGHVNIDFTSSNGKNISILSNQIQPAGEYIKELHVKNLVPGIYFITLTFTDKTGTPKATSTTLLKH